MNKLIIILFILFSVKSFSQDRVQVRHGDTLFLVTHTYTTVPDSTVTAATETEPRSVVYWNRIISTQKDSIQLNKLGTSQLNNTAGFTTATRLIDSIYSVRNMINSEDKLAAADSNNIHYTRFAAKMNYNDTPNLFYTKFSSKFPYSDTANLHYTKLAAKFNYTDTNNLHYVQLAAKAPLVSASLTTPVIGVASGTSLAVTGALTSSGTAGIGYATGAGGAVSQATSKSTGVTLNKICGTITMVNSALAAAAEVAFTLTNSTIAANDVVVVSIKSGATAGAYFTSVGAVGAASCSITLGNASAGSLSEAVVINFVVIKAVAN